LRPAPDGDGWLTLAVGDCKEASDPTGVFGPGVPLVVAGGPLEGAEPGTVGMIVPVGVPAPPVVAVEPADVVPPGVGGAGEGTVQ